MKELRLGRAANGWFLATGKAASLRERCLSWKPAEALFLRKTHFGLDYHLVIC